MPRCNSLLVFLSAALLSILAVGCGGGGKKALSISGTLPSSGTVNVSYPKSTLTANGGSGGYMWTTSGLPTGLMVQGSLDARSIKISGTPTTAGPFTASATVTDSDSNMATYTVTITIAPTNSGPTVSTTSLPSGTEGSSYSTTLAATGGSPPYTWAQTSGGSLPGGLMLTPGTGAIAGTPTLAGTFGPYVFTVTDAKNAMAASASLTIVIAAAPVAACAPSPTPRGNEAALSAPFAFVLAGSFGNNDDPTAWAGSFTPDGRGGILAGDLDFTNTAEGVLSLHILVGASSYSYGSDGRGCLYLSFGAAPAAVSGSRLPIEGNIVRRHGSRRLRAVQIHPEGVIGTAGNVTFSFSLGQLDKYGRIEQFDYVTSRVQAAGNIHIQTAGDFSLNKLAGRFAFGAAGWFNDGQGIERASIAGSTNNSNGTLMNSFADNNIGGFPSGELSGGSGTLSSVSSTTGRGTGSYTIPDNGTTLTFNFAYYVVNQDYFFIVTTDDPGQPGAVQLTGRAINSASTPPVPNGFYMFGASGLDLDAGPIGMGDNVAAIGTVQLTSQGAVPKATLYQNDAGSFTTKPFTNGSYVLETASGRLALTGVGNQPPISYLTASNGQEGVLAFLVGTDSGASSGFLLGQSMETPNFNTGSIQGGYATGTTEDVAGISGSLVGQFEFSSGGQYNASVDVVDVGETASQPNLPFNGTVAVNADGSGDFDSSAKNLVTNGTYILAIDGDGIDQPYLYVFVQQGQQ